MQNWEKKKVFHDKHWIKKGPDLGLLLGIWEQKRVNITDLGSYPSLTSYALPLPSSSNLLPVLSWNTYSYCWAHSIPDDVIWRTTPSVGRRFRRQVRRGCWIDGLSFTSLLWHGMIAVLLDKCDAVWRFPFSGVRCCRVRRKFIYVSEEDNASVFRVEE
jgi:hypothetical protein